MVYLLRLETSITDEQLRKQVVTEEVVQAELEAQRRLLEVEHQRKMAAIRDEMENEVKCKCTTQMPKTATRFFVVRYPWPFL